MFYEDGETKRERVVLPSPTGSVAASRYKSEGSFRLGVDVVVHVNLA